MVVDFIETAICKGSSWRGRIRNDIYAGSIGTWSEVTMTEELMIGLEYS